MSASRPIVSIVSIVSVVQRVLRLVLVLALVPGLPGAGRQWARAQVPDLLELSGAYLPGVPVEVPGSSEARAQVASYSVAINVPLVLGRSSFLVPGLAYRVDAASYRGVPDTFDDLRAFHGLDVSLLYIQLLPRDWSLALRVAPGLAGDLSSVDSGALRLSGAALAVHAFSDGASLGGGVIASYGFGSFMVLPAVYLSLGADDDPVGFELFFPAFARFEVRPLDGLEFGLRVEVSGSSYSVRDPRIAERWPCVEGVDRVDRVGGAARPDAKRCFDNLAYSVVSASAFVAVELWDSLWLDLAAGHTLYRRFDPRNQDGGAVDAGGQDLPNTLEMKVGVTLRLPRG
jgi:hypothetical protein